MPRKKPAIPKKYDLGFGLPLDRELRPDELELGTPRAQEIIQAALRGDMKAVKLATERLNIIQLNQFHALVMGLKQASDAKQSIPANVMDFMIAKGRGLYKETKHIRLIGEHLVVAEKADSPHLLISMPPGHGKSTSVGFWGLAKYMAKHPERHCALIMHKYDKAEQRVKRIRNWIRSDGKEFGLALDETSKGAGAFRTSRGGSLSAYGTGSGITGDRFNGLVVIDDPVKGQEMVRSGDQRDHQWEWFLAEVLNRLDPGGKIVGTATRWHGDDLWGRCLTRMEEVPEAVKFDYLLLPAIATEDDDPIGRNKGEALWPERFSLQQLETIRATYTPFMWSALYQGTPTPEEGASFQRSWWQFYEKPPEKPDLIIQSWDLAFGDLQTSDYTVGIVMARRGPHVYVLDVIRQRADFAAAVELIRATSRRWPSASGKLVEKAANGWAAVVTLASELPGIMPITPSASKEIRAQAVMPYVEAKNVWLPKAAPWLDAFLLELSQFPNAKYDDQVDAFSQGLNYLMHGGYASKAELERQAREAKPPETCVEIVQRQFSQHVSKVMAHEERRINGMSLPSSSRWNYPSDRIPTPGGEIV